MPELVIALLMIVNGEIKEHRIQESMSNCLKGKRIAMRDSKKSVQYQCIKSMAARAFEYISPRWRYRHEVLENLTIVITIAWRQYVFNNHIAAIVNIGQSGFKLVCRQPGRYGHHVRRTGFGDIVFIHGGVSSWCQIKV